MFRVTCEKVFEGLLINQNHQGCYVELLHRLIAVTNYSVQCFTRPEGYHVRIRLAQGAGISRIMDRIQKRYSRPGVGRKKPNTFKPLFLRVREVDDADDGEHHHIALILDGKKAKPASLSWLLNQLQQEGLLQSYMVSKSLKFDVPNVSLSNGAGLSEYVHWLSYICKVRSKDLSRRSFDSSRIPKAVSIGIASGAQKRVA